MNSAKLIVDRAIALHIHGRAKLQITVEPPSNWKLTFQRSNAIAKTSKNKLQHILHTNPIWIHFHKPIWKRGQRQRRNLEIIAPPALKIVPPVSGGLSSALTPPSPRPPTPQKAVFSQETGRPQAQGDMGPGEREPLGGAERSLKQQERVLSNP